MSCVTYRRLLSTVAAGGSAPPGLGEHLACCPDCSRELSSLRSALRLVDDYLGEQVGVQPPPALAARIERALEAGPVADVLRHRWLWALAGSAVAAGLMIVLSFPDAKPRTRPDRPARETSLTARGSPGERPSAASVVPDAAPPRLTNPRPPAVRARVAGESSFEQVVVLDGQLEALTRIVGDPTHPWPDPAEGPPVRIEALSVDPLKIEPLVIPAL